MVRIDGGDGVRGRAPAGAEAEATIAARLDDADRYAAA
jgi:hypothetical protein